MTAAIRLVLYGDSVFIAGIRADLQQRSELEVVHIGPDCPDPLGLIRAARATAVLFDLTGAQPDFAVALLAERPDLLLIGLDPSSDEMLVLSLQREPAASIVDLVKVIQPHNRDPSQNPAGGIL